MQVNAVQVNALNKSDSLCQPMPIAEHEKFTGLLNSKRCNVSSDVMYLSKFRLNRLSFVNLQHMCRELFLEPL